MRFSLLLLLFMIFAPMAHAKTLPFKPKLILNEDPALCQPFADMWLYNFNSVKDVDEANIEPQQFFQNEDIISIGGGRGVYGEVHIFKAKLKDEEKTFLLSSYDIGWRYLGAKLHIIQNEKSFSNYMQAPIETGLLEYGIGRKLTTREGIKDELAFKIADLPPASSFHFFAKNDALYYITPDFRLQKIKLDGSQDICQMQMQAKNKDYHDFFTAAEQENFKALIGGLTGACGTSGPFIWRNKGWDVPFNTIFDRPQVIESHPLDIGEKKFQKSWQKSNIAAQLRVLRWGLQDPVSWQVALDIDKNREEVISRLNDYYFTNILKNNVHANVLAHKAYQYLMDELIYDWYMDNHSIIYAAGYFEKQSYSSLSEVVETIYEAWSNEKEIGSIYELYILLFYTKANIEKINKVHVGLLQGFKSHKNFDEASMKPIHTSALLAAIGDEGLMELALQHGADVNAQTNDFAKTPLMYAAQLNDLKAVKFLLNKSADINKVTKGNHCTSLKRDNRSALTYAAEYVQAEIIELLIEKGADTSIKDTQGNDLLWYLARNKRLSSAEKEKMSSLLKIK